MQESREPTRASHQRIATHVDDLEALVGAHVEALESMFLRSPAADPSELGELPRGVVLALAASSVHLALRPVVRALAGRNPWTGVVFDHGGCAGANRFLGREGVRFRAERGPSRLDGGPALVLTYEGAGWPFSSLRDELRAIGPGLAMGPTFYGDRLVAWFGLTRG